MPNPQYSLTKAENSSELSTVWFSSNTGHELNECDPTSLRDGQDNGTFQYSLTASNLQIQVRPTGSGKALILMEETMRRDTNTPRHGNQEH